MKTVLMAIVASLAMSAHAQTSIRMYAAENLRPAIDEIAMAYTSARVEAQYGSSTQLRDRIAAGERPAVFASADVERPHSLAREGLAGPVKRFARDRYAEYGLVLVDGAGEEAWYFAQFVLSPDGQAILAKHGFSPGASASAASK
jgi:ABC-type molybdate transport system substrate-binding protein